LSIVGLQVEYDEQRKKYRAQAVQGGFQGEESRGGGGGGGGGGDRYGGSGGGGGGGDRGGDRY
jgi:hypothetical protein